MRGSEYRKQTAPVVLQLSHDDMGRSKIASIDFDVILNHNILFGSNLTRISWTATYLGY